MGLGIALYFALPEEPEPFWAWLLLIPLPLALLVRLRGFSLAAWGAGLAAAAGLGFALAMLQTALRAPLTLLPEKAVMLTGVVQAVELLPEGRRLTLGGIRAIAVPSRDEPPLATAIDPGTGKVIPPPEAFTMERTLRLRLRAADPARPEPGDSVTLRALLREPSAPAYPGGWDFQRAAFFADQGGSAQALGPAEVVPGKDGAAAFAGLRAAIEARITAALPGAEGAISAALLTGGTSAIPEADLAAMRDSGLAHLLSVSGLHIAVVMGLVFAVTRFLVALIPPIALRWDSKAAAVLLGLVAGGAYMVLTGNQVPMIRSFAMAALVALGVLLGRRAISLRTLAFAAVVVLAVQPFALLGPSFQMSFAAVLALIAGWEAMRGRLAGLRGEGQWWRLLLIGAAGLVFTSVLAGAATLPYGLYHFGRMQLYGVAANAIAIPLTSFLVMPAGMLALLLMPFGLEGLALWPMGLGVQGVLATAHWVAAWPGAAMAAPPIPLWGLGLVTFGMLWLCLWRARWRLWGLPLIIAGMASGLFARQPDLLVSGDARLIALRTPSGVMVQRVSGGSAFVRDSWLRGWGEEGAEPMPSQGEAAAGLVNCNELFCQLRKVPGGPSILLLKALGRRGPHPVAPREVCGGVALVVSAEPVDESCPGVPFIDRFSVWREGPFAVWLGPQGARRLSDRADRGDRPWVLPTP
ncbi:ComEC/Rec2 family competence protein [Acetobacteraceae bacterium H6797]|nr:ComEC/Rec2 family competence protein [Acetobacteraceae bacterium H6797]